MKKHIANPTETKVLIEKYGFSFQKRFGQNFLIDTNIIEHIIDGAGITDEDVVLEIGPGIGSLTQWMADRAKKVIAVEIDKKLIPMLEETLADYENIRIINDDILKVDIQQLLTEEGVDSFKVVANLPYYITTPIIMGLLENHLPVESITVMIQKEVAERIDAVPGTKDYGTLSLAIAYYGTSEIVTHVAPGCFIPKPKVGSAVIKITLNKEPAVEVQDEALMFLLIKGGFAQRRKTFINSVTGGVRLPYSKEQVLEAMEAIGLEPRIRGERLSLKDYADLANHLIKLPIVNEV